MKCLFCYKPLADGEVDYHKSCARKIFESATVPLLLNYVETSRNLIMATNSVIASR